MITAYFLHIYDHSDDLSYNFDKEINEITQLNPDKIICFSVEEVDADHIMRVFFERIQPWLIENNKVITVLAPGIDGKKITPNSTIELNLGFNLVIEWLMISYLNKIRESYEDVHLDADRLFTCYNNRPCIERLRMVDTLVKHNLLSQGIITYAKPDAFGKESWQHHDGSVLRDEEDFEMHTTEEFTPYKLPKSFFKGFLDIVCESRVKEPEHFMTEKTVKSLLTLKPFIAMSTVNYQKFLEDTYGIEPYTELFDYSFDSMPEYTDRIEGIVDNVARLPYLITDRTELLKVHDLLLPKLIRNRDRLLQSLNDKDKMFPKALEFMIDGSEYKIYGSQTNPVLMSYINKSWIVDYHNTNFSNVLHQKRIIQ